MTVTVGDKPSGPEEWFHEITWQLQPRASLQCVERGRSCTWLIFADQGGWGFTLQNLLKDAGEECYVVLPGLRYEQSAAGVFRLVPQEAEHYRRLLQEVQEMNGPPLCGVIHLWSLDDERLIENFSVQLEAGQQRVCGSALFLAQSLMQTSGGDLPRLCLVTRGALAVAPPVSPLNLTPASLWGFGRTVAQEHPELRCLCLDLDSNGNAHTAAQQIFDELRAGERENQVAFRTGERYVARLARIEISAAIHPGSDDPHATCHEQRATSNQQPASLLITGGTRGLGLRVAQWLVDQGAQHLILLSRSQPDEEAAAAIAELKQKGATVRVIQANVAHLDQLAEALTESQEGMPPLRGVIHTASVRDDRALLEQDWTSFATVMAPKISGAWNLHVLTQDLPLDFFVMFSSTVAVLGAPGQSNYAAANAF
ncbi:SDR family NAD(P)-dependent oxidoreductase, partial [candidate division KSB1 bacterium]|nr:SDR family NAD(P)-dependent oxidoreductase [candidate division KSB1 bacterium]